MRLRVSAKAWEEARHELPRRAERILAQGRLTRPQADALLASALRVAEERAVPIPSEAFGAFEEPAAYRIPRDPDDVPTVALALALGGAEGGCGIWTGDGDFLGCGIPRRGRPIPYSHIHATPGEMEGELYGSTEGLLPGSPPHRQNRESGKRRWVTNAGHVVRFRGGVVHNRRKRGPKA